MYKLNNEILLIANYRTEKAKSKGSWGKLEALIQFLMLKFWPA